MISGLYSDEPGIQILLALMKAHNVTKIIISPGTTNVTFVASVQKDSDFTLYSAPDERSAAYMACGLAAETGTPVALSCTGATASRNYVPGLTEAYYRHLPVLAITMSQPLERAGQGMPQMLDRSVQMKDLVRKSVTIPYIHDEEDRWGANTLINDALLELTHSSGGPVHINMVSHFSMAFNVKELPRVRVIRRITPDQTFPTIMHYGHVAVFVGAHRPFSDELQAAIDSFCETHNAVVFCDQTSNYRGKYRVLGNLIANQDRSQSSLVEIDLMIHIGDISGAYMRLRPKNVWRVSKDGAVQDTFRKLTHVFQMSELDFFQAYSEDSKVPSSYLEAIRADEARIRSSIPDLPFSNLWCASKMAPRLPGGSTLHLGILNSLRSWSYFDTPSDVTCFANTGGFGIDGCVSTIVGASLANYNHLVFGVVGDLAFFYDMNSLGNRHIGPNIRLMVVNNGEGIEFRNYSHMAAPFGQDADAFIAASGHYGQKSPDLLRHYASDLGFEYMSASSKDDFDIAIARFLEPKVTNAPMLLEVFTDTTSESDALEMINSLEVDIKGTLRQTAKSMLGPQGIGMVKKVLGR